mgnify:CR=1 FL=1
MAIVSLLASVGIYFAVSKSVTGEQAQYGKRSISNSSKIKLPSPRYNSDVSIEQALLKRRSVRKYKAEPLTIAEVSQLLWSAQGITNPSGFRTAPSAGALYPLEVYLVVGEVKGLSQGIYKYLPRQHELLKIKDGDVRRELAIAALGQSWVKDAAVDIVFAAVYERVTRKYGKRGIRYVHMEVGHAAENVYLQAVSLKLGTVVVGAFEDEKVKKILNMAESEQPLYIMPIGKL